MIKTGFDAMDRSSEGLGARSVSEPAPPFARLTLRAHGRPGSGSLLPTYVRFLVGLLLASGA